MAQHISNFISNFAGGLRPNRFLLTIGTSNIPYHIRSTALPGVVTNPINIPYRGRVFKMPGWRSYPSFRMTVLDDQVLNGQGRNLWNDFVAWSSSIFNHGTNIGAGGNFTSAMKLVTIKQLDVNGNAVPGRLWTLQNAWPSDVGEIRLSMDDNESYTTFNVTLEYSGMV